MNPIAEDIIAVSFVITSTATLVSSILNGRKSDRIARSVNGMVEKQVKAGHDAGETEGFAAGVKSETDKNV